MITVKRRFGFSLCAVPPESFLRLNLRMSEMVRVREDDRKVTRSGNRQVEDGNDDLSSYCRESELS